MNCSMANSTLYNPYMDAPLVFSKKRKKHFFDPENIKKLPSKVAHNRPTFFMYALAWLPKRPRNRNPVAPKALAGLGI